MDNRPSAFFLSAALHGGVAAILVLTAYVFKEKPPVTTKIFELVAGAGDNYNATVAAALGEEGGVKVNVPKPPVRKAEPALAPLQAEEPKPVAPLEPVPIPVTPLAVKKAPPVVEKTKAPEKKPLTIAQKMRRQIWAADSKEKAKAKKERELDAKRLAKEKADAKTKEKSAPTKVAKLNPEGIRNGVVGGSIENKIGGAGGTALSVEERSEAENYLALLQQRLKDELDQTPGLDDGLRAEAELHILPDGRLTRAQITKSSRNEPFDLAVLKAIRTVKMPRRPKGVDEVLVVPFGTRAKD